MSNMQDTKKKFQLSWEVSSLGIPEIWGNIKSVENNKEKKFVIRQLLPFLPQHRKDHEQFRMQTAAVSCVSDTRRIN